VKSSLSNSRPQSDNNCLGALNLENTFIVNARATVEAVWLRIGMASAHLEK